MSVLRKKIDKNLGVPKLETRKLLAYWEQTKSFYLSGCESLIEHLHWKEVDVKVSQGSLEDIKSKLPDTGLYTSFGNNIKDTQAVFLLDNALASIIAKHGFTGRIKTFDGIQDYEISKIDSLMMDPLIATTHRALDNSSWPVRNDYLEKAELPFAQYITNCIQIEFLYEVSFGPQSEGQAIRFTLIVPSEYMLPRLAAFQEQIVSKPVSDSDQSSEILSRHVDQSVTSLRAVLEKRKMTVADCTRLEIGQIISLPGVSLKEMKLEATLRDDKICVVTGALGIHKSNRAIKLTADLSPEFIKTEFSNASDI